MALYQRLGDDGGASPAAPAPSASAFALGATFGLVPMLIVGYLFWAALASPPAPRSSYRGRKH
jgi:hypothetical protein